MSSFKAEFLVSGEWCTNALRFETEAEAAHYATNLFMRWTQPSDKRTAPSEDPVNYRWDSEKGLVSL